jgi:ethanolamine utilization protein EutQ
VLHCAGQASVDADGKPVHEGDMQGRVTRSLDNLEIVLGEASRTSSVSTTTRPTSTRSSRATTQPHDMTKPKEDIMSAPPAGISKFTVEDVDTWYRSGDRKIFLSDVLDPSNSESMSVGFARYAPGESNEWIVTYDEALIVTRGAYTVTSADGVETTARAGEVIFLRKNIPVVYSAKEEGADVVYVTYPHWMKAQEASQHSALLDTFQPSEDRPEPSDAVALIRSIYEQQERGEPEGFHRFQDALAEDVVLTTPVGEVRGKQAVIGYFSNAAATLEFDIFVRPLEYFGDGNRVVQVGGEIFTVKETGATREADWAWVFDVEDALITRILAIQDLSGVADEVAEALAKARKEASAQPMTTTEQ